MVVDLVLGVDRRSTCNNISSCCVALEVYGCSFVLSCFLLLYHSSTNNKNSSWNEFTKISRVGDSQESKVSHNRMECKVEGSRGEPRYIDFLWKPQTLALNFRRLKDMLQINLTTIYPNTIISKWPDFKIQLWIKSSTPLPWVTRVGCWWIRWKETMDDD